jgi:signal transduction histidine kinase
VIPSVLLMVFGWRGLQQEAHERSEQAADLAVASLQQSLAKARGQLQDSSLTSSQDLAVVVFTPGSVEGKLLYYPFTVAGKEAAADVFSASEGLEFRTHDSAGAAALYRNLSHSSDPAVRAGALIRLARRVQKPAALAAYGQAAELRGVAVAGMPADLFARWAECRLLTGDDLKQKTAALRADLLGGRWHLDRTTFEALYSEEWMGGAAPLDAGEMALAGGAEWLWKKWQAGPTSGHETVQIEGRRLTILWDGDATHLSAFIAGPDFVQSAWLSKLPVPVTLRDPLGQPGSSAESRRTASDTGLPWTVVVETGSRRSVWLAGLGVLALLVIVGTYAILRAVARELAVARLQSDFVSAVSHEFRTPLTSLRQLTEILNDGRVASEDRRRTYYQALARQTERLHQLVESLLDFGRMEAGTSPYRLEPLDACALVRSVVEQFESEAEGRGYHVELDVNGTTATVDGDREALTNALWNLLDNAVKYSLECRTVWVDVERDEARLAIRVRDRGLGIPREEQKDIFRKFVRGADAKAQNIKGTGIGLAMVDHIVKAHGGEVRLQSEPGAGSTFTLLLPCHES